VRGAEGRSEKADPLSARHTYERRRSLLQLTENSDAEFFSLLSSIGKLTSEEGRHSIFVATREVSLDGLCDVRGEYAVLMLICILNITARYGN
jgi:hypothetical protein